MVMQDTTLVIGHRNPDMDAVASAVGYAWLLNEQHGGGYTAARVGDINAQTAFALSYFNTEAPQLVSDVRPRVRDVVEMLPALRGEPTLKDASQQYALTKRAVALLDEADNPRGLLSAASLFGSLVDAMINETNGTLQGVLNQPATRVMDSAPVVLRDNDTLTQALQRVKRAQADDYIVVDANGRYVGLCRTSAMFATPHQKLILVDHNEPGQAVPGIEEAEVEEVLDHHRVDSVATVLPIRFRIEPVGSCSTLVAEHARDRNIMLPSAVAGLLLCGILSDTLVFQSVTTTPRDQKAAHDLAQMANLTGDPAEAIQTFGRALLMAGAGLGTRAPEEIIGSDQKFYETERGSVSMSQVEVTHFDELEGRLPQLKAAMGRLVNEKSLALALLMVTDILRGNSRIIAMGDASLIADLPYAPLPDGTLDAKGVVSRKKQLVPVVLAAVKQA
jgi:manganese-dependent inorganic pyrophosphatase